MKTVKKSTHEEPIHIEASPLEVARSFFTGKPKPRRKWLYLKQTKSEKQPVKVNQ